MKGFKRISSLVVGVAFFGAASSAMAVLSLPSGWYTEGNIGYTNINNANFGATTTYKSSGAGINILGGYKFMPYFATELGATKYSNITIKSGGVSVAKASYWSWNLAMKGILPVEDSGFELFAKLGIGRLYTNVTTTNASYITANGLTISTGNRASTGAVFGLGANYYFNPFLPVIFQWQRVKGSNISGNADLYSIGISYLFG